MVIDLIRNVIFLVCVFVLFKGISSYYAFKSTNVVVFNYNVGGGGFDSFLQELKWRVKWFWKTFRVFVLFLAIGYIIQKLSGDPLINLISFATAVYAFSRDRDVFEFFSGIGYEKNIDKLEVVDAYLMRFYKDPYLDNYKIEMKKNGKAYDIILSVGRSSVPSDEAKSKLVRLIKEATGIAGITLQDINIKLRGS